jgi:hypothetical protein
MTVVRSVRRTRGEEAGISKERLPRSEVKEEGRARGEEEQDGARMGVRQAESGIVV